MICDNFTITTNKKNPYSIHCAAPSCKTNYITHFYLQLILANFIIVYTSQNRLITTNREYFLFLLTFICILVNMML